MWQESFSEWKSRGFYYESKNKIFYQDINYEATETLLILHGYPTCGFDYTHVIDRLGSRYRLIIPDFAGFGLSAKPSDSKYLLSEQAKSMVDLINHLHIKTLDIVAHDYGTSVCTEIIALHLERKLPFAIRHITLCNGSMLIHMSQLRPIQKLLKNALTGPLIAFLSNENTFHRNMKKLWHDPQLYNQDHMKTLWMMLKYNSGKKRLPVITRYIEQRYQHYDRWIGALRKTEIPIHILWAENDPVAVIEMAYELSNIIKCHQLTTMPSCGHYPMIEQPVLWSRCVMKGIDDQFQRSAI